jgi:undecaprenyl diphosphate synthase
VEATRRLILKGIPAQDIDETVVGQYLYTAGIPDPDLIIRTGGEMRLSNFLTWQSAYAEIYFTPTLWPDFDKKEIDKALTIFSQRQRRFGSLAPE